MWSLFIFLAASLAVAQSGISDTCLACICQVESNCKQIGCKMDVGSLSCGPYQIKYNYWLDCHSPGSGWKACAQDFGCSAGCVRTYTARYGKYCTGGRTPSCEDYARIHNGGPIGCRKSSTLPYWNRVKRCLESKSRRLFWQSIFN